MPNSVCSVILRPQSHSVYFLNALTRKTVRHTRNVNVTLMKINSRLPSGNIRYGLWRQLAVKTASDMYPEQFNTWMGGKRLNICMQPSSGYAAETTKKTYLVIYHLAAVTTSGLVCNCEKHYVTDRKQRIIMQRKLSSWKKTVTGNHRLRIRKIRGFISTQRAICCRIT
jgi:hypothetical protein